MDAFLLLTIFGFSPWTGEFSKVLLFLPASSTQDFRVQDLKVQNLRTENIQRLSVTEITQQLQLLPRWQQREQTIVYTHQFKNFIESVNFVQCLVEPAERLGHHPDLMISYNTVTITLTTHDAGGLTYLDFKVAQAIDQVLKQWTPEKICS